MDPLHIGILREEKRPIERRAPLTPAQAQQVQHIYPHLKIYVEASSTRCFSDQSYEELGIEVVHDLSHCHMLFGVKEVPIEKLIPRKVYFFFSHTAKKQPYNRALLQAILRERIQLIDYEYLTDNTGQRQIAFGYYAGIVGAHNALWAYGLKKDLYQLPRAKDTHNYRSLLQYYRSLKLPPLRIVLTGRGRVGHGAAEVLQAAGCAQLSPHDFLKQRIDSPIYTHLSSMDYYQRKDKHSTTKADFYAEPEQYVSTFWPFAQTADILIIGTYWDPRAPSLFTIEETKRKEFSIDLIADITCDIDGASPITKKASTIEDPLYDYHPDSQKVVPFKPGSAITLMAVDNLPSELPTDASQAFGEQLIDNLFPHLLYHPDHPMIERATITKDGILRPLYKYLEAWVAN